jgi:uncharacterized protein YqhQ
MQSSVYIGGQAVLEGVMMRSPKSFVVAVRKPNGEIVVREQPWETLLSWLRPLRWPFVRGAVVLVESLWNGLSALNFSAEQALPEAEGAATANTSSGEKASAASRAALAGTLGLSMLVGIALFVGLPHALTWLLGVALGVPLDTRSVAFHAIDGTIKLAIFLGYLWGISRMKEIRRVFEYHGAEHKAIWAYETGGPLTPENAAKFTTLHPRCGTSFLIIVLGISIVVFAVVFPFVPQVSANKLVNNLFMVAFKIPLMFPVAGLSYEFQRLSARPNAPRFVKWLTAPGLKLQKITTQEPSREQLEISLVALSRALAHEQGKLSDAGVRFFRSFDGALAVP